MTKEIYVSSTPHETKVALVEDDQLAEIFFERENEYTLAGSIYKGRVTRVLPGMQSAFVDVGLERDAFLYVSDFLELGEDEESEFDEIAVSRPEAFVSHRPTSEPPRYPFKPEAAPVTPEAPEEQLEDEEGEEAEGDGPEFAEAASPTQERPEEDAERLRGNRRRRRGRRGRGFPDNKFARPGREEGPESGEVREPRSEIREPRIEVREPREDYGPPPGFQPIILPGESLSKYSPRAITPAAEPPISALEPRPAGTEAEDSEVETASRWSEVPAVVREPESAPEPQPRTQSEPPREIGDLPPRTTSVLPGESIAKYQPRESGPASAAAEQPESPARPPSRYERRDRAPSRGVYAREGGEESPERRPRFEREPRDYAPQGESFAVLPGESIAKYRNTNSSAQIMARQQAEHAAEVPHAAEAEQAAEVEPRNTPRAATFVIESEPWSETLAPQAKRSEAEEKASTAAVPAGPESTPEVAQAAPSAESQAEDEKKFEQMNLAAVFGGDAVEPPAPEAKAEPAATAPESTPHDTGELDERIQTMIIGGAFGDVLDQEEDEAPASAAGVAVTPESLEPAAPDTPAVEDAIGQIQPQRGTKTRDEHLFGHPGQGTLEHEEIEGEEEESHFHPPTDVDPDADYLELEEETLEAGSPRAAEAGADSRTEAEQLTEAVEESDVERAVMSDAYETEDETEFDEDTEFEEEELVDGEDALPEEQQEEAIGRAEVRAPSPMAGYQRSAERVPFDRRRSGRRGGGGGGGTRGRVVRRHEAPRQQVQISDLLKEGQEVLVQIAKEPIGKKGARITSHIALPGRFLVYMPTVNHVGVSRKITSDEERLRLKRIMISEREGGHGGFIVRTAAAGVGEDELRADIRFLKNLWAQIKQRAESSKPPALIYHDLNLVERILRDQVTSDFATIWVDTEQEYERILNFANRFQPSLVRRVKLYSRDTPLFEQFGINEEINNALKAKVWLKSGGYIVINQTEALVAIDINTGKYVGKTARLEDTIVKTNIDAIREIVRQIRLRDLGGIIVIDFIDMDERKNRQKVMQALEEALKSDRSPSKVLAFNDFGLVAITRKRVKQSLERTLGSLCPYCTGNGFVKAVTTVCNEIYVELRKMARHLERSDIVNLRVNPEVAKALKADKGKWLADFEEVSRRTVLVKPDPMLHQEQFDIHS